MRIKVYKGKTYTGEFPNNKQKINHGEQNQFFVKEAHSPIIANEVFNPVQKEMKHRSNMEIVHGEKEKKIHTIVQRIAISWEYL